MDDFDAELEREDLHLARACLLLSRHFRPDVDVDAYLARFDPWVERVDTLADTMEVPTALRGVLAEEEAFRGNVAEYQDPENSFLDAVIDRRLGLPITLGVVYLEVARRLGKPLVAVSMPGHFLLRYEETLLDPFHGGRAITEGEAQLMLDRLSGGQVRLTRDMLAPTPDRDVLARVITNLKNAFVQTGQALKAIEAEDLILQVSPLAFHEYRDRGLLKRAVGDVDGARADLAQYVQAMPDAPDADAVRRVLAGLDG